MNPLSPLKGAQIHPMGRTRQFRNSLQTKAGMRRFLQAVCSAVGIVWRFFVVRSFFRLFFPLHQLPEIALAPSCFLIPAVASLPEWVGWLLLGGGKEDMKRTENEQRQA